MKELSKMDGIYERLASALGNELIVNHFDGILLVAPRLQSVLKIQPNSKPTVIEFCHSGKNKVDAFFV